MPLVNHPFVNDFYANHPPTTMSYDDDWPDNTLETRRAAIRKTIRPATLEELKQLGDQCFPVVTDPWAERYAAFLKLHPSAKYYRAQTAEGAQIVYCRDTEQGIWLLPGCGMGIIQPSGLRMLAELTGALAH